MLIGEHHHTLDPKGRTAVPAKFRARFSDGLVITRGMDHCLFGYPQAEWGKVVEQVTKLPISQQNARAFARLMLAGAVEVELDAQGRMLIPGYLRQYAQLDKKIVIVGIHSRIELWDERAWQQYQQQTEANAAEIAEQIGHLGM